METAIGILENLAISFIYGYLVLAFIIFYFNICEKIQFWSEQYNPPKNWTRRALHVISAVVFILVFLYSFLLWASFIADSMKEIFSSLGLVLLMFCLNCLFLITPAIYLRKKILRKIYVKKPWE